MGNKKASQGKNFIRKIRARKPKKSRKQRGGKIVFPQSFFNEGHTNHYHTQDQLVRMGRVNPNAVSMGNNNGSVNTIGGNHVPGIGLNPQMGGGGLPVEYFGGNSGRYFAEGSPGLQNCTTAYGIAHPTSHGVVLPGDNAGWMGPNLAPYPNYLSMTGGSRKRRSRSRKTKKTKKSKKANKSKKNKVIRRKGRK